MLAMRRRVLVLTTLLVQSCSPSHGREETPRADWCIADATIHEGAGEAPVMGHVAIRDGRIVSVGTGPGPEAHVRIDATGLIVAPGFIDLHTHSDRGIIKPATRAAVNYLLQGCTTSVTGNCGFGPLDVQRYYDQVDEAGAGTNVAHLIPQGTLRSHVVGTVDRPATAAEVADMRTRVHQGMQDGAWGMSTGLIYTPGTYADTAELIELTTVVGEHGGIYASHVRGEEDQLLESIGEALRIGRTADVPVHISHLKVKGTPNWGSLRLAIAVIEEAQAAGLRVTADQYPYVAAATSLAATVFPPWSLSGGTKSLLDRLDDPATAARIRDEVARSLRLKEEGGQIMIAEYAPRPDWVGRNVRDIATAEQVTPLEITETIMRHGGARIVNFAMHEQDVRLAMTRTWVATASDGEVLVPSATRLHPRSFGTFPRKIGYYAIQEGVVPLEQAIRSATGLPADILGITDRGYLRPGQAADIVVFDPRTFRDNATFEAPYRYATGVRHVFVNGVPAVYDGVPTGALAGRALRKVREPR